MSIRSKVIKTWQYGYRSFGIGYFWTDFDNLTIHIDLWWWSFHFETERS